MSATNKQIFINTPLPVLFTIPRHMGLETSYSKFRLKRAMLVYAALIDLVRQFTRQHKLEACSSSLQRFVTGLVFLHMSALTRQNVWGIVFSLDGSLSAGIAQIVSLVPNRSIRDVRNIWSIGECADPSRLRVRLTHIYNCIRRPISSGTEMNHGVSMVRW